MKFHISALNFLKEEKIDVKIIDILYEIAEKIILIIYPNVCNICFKSCDLPICNICMNKLNKEIINGRKIYIPTKNRYIDEHIYLFRYTKEIKKILGEYKFKEASYQYKTFSYLILNNKKIMKQIRKYDYILPIPIHKERKKYRGYNQSELIIKELNKNDVSIKFEKDILKKIKNIVPQSTLKKEERVLNIQNAYELNKKEICKVKNKKILLFDDIYTTGSTSNECARVLKKYGAREVGILTIAKD